MNVTIRDRIPPFAPCRIAAATLAPLLAPGLALALALAAAAPGCAPGERQDEPSPRDDGSIAVAWNQALLSAAEAEDGFLTLKGVRAAALLHTAMLRGLTAADGDEGLAAGMAAAHRVASDQYPGAAATWDALRDGPLDAVDAAIRERGSRRGVEVADALLASRRDDGWNGEAEYTFHPMGPGVYAEFNEHSGTPEGFVFGAGWAQARPILLPSAEAFRSPPPPAIDSAEYTRAFDEVKSVGRHESDTRTADQAHLAMWWKEFVESSHNRLARELVERDGLDLVRANRMFALMNTAIFDGYVAVFDSKFHYNHWRPYTAIRWAAHDGNPDTAPDPDWNNLHLHTYAFPSYPSAHGTACAAAMTVLADTFGASRPFTMRIPVVDRAGPMSGKVEMDPPTRSFDSFGDAAVECSLSRVYLGIHFRYDSEAGTALGSRVGRYVLEHL